MVIIDQVARNNNYVGIGVADLCQQTLIVSSETGVMQVGDLYNSEIMKSIRKLLAGNLVTGCFYTQITPYKPNRYDSSEEHKSEDNNGFLSQIESPDFSKSKHR